MLQTYKIITTLIILITLSVGTVQAQDKWRAINFTASAGSELTSATVLIPENPNTFVGGSIGLHWDFDSKYYLSNWNGVYYSIHQPFSDWYSSQLTVNRRISILGGTSMGLGFQYRNDLQGNDSVFIMGRVSKTVRLN